jgi:hypothetical protein
MAFGCLIFFGRLRSFKLRFEVSTSLFKTMSESLMSFSDGVEFQVADLSFHWPLHSLEWEHLSELTSRIYIRGRDQFGGWKVELLEAHENQTYKQIWSIPPQYGNTLGIINSKIMWLQAFLARRIPVKNKKSAKGKQDMQTIAVLRDSVARCLIFDHGVRDMFFREVRRAFYGAEGTPLRSFNEIDYGWRSKFFDSWLHVEYEFKSHLPPSYIQIRETGWVKKHPKDVTLEGLPPSSMLNSLSV